MSYDPCEARYLNFSTARVLFSAGTDTPRDFLERCLERISTLDSSIKAFVCLDVAEAQKSADAATTRWREGRPLSKVDGMPIGIKDCFDVRGFPTKVNSKFLMNSGPVSTDAAHVDALRKGGAIIVGKTVTTEFTMAEPGPTSNPWNTERTPGGSSSGSAAAVAGCMLPLATGSQVRGSVIRPASLCGIIGMKPSFGALNQHGGIDPSPSLNHLGLLSGSLVDTWETASYIGSTAGGDPGYKALTGPSNLPASRRPLRLGRQYTSGWAKTDEASKALFELFIKSLAAAGIEIIEPRQTDELLAYEKLTTATPDFFFDLMLWEIRWPLIPWYESAPEAFSETMSGHIRNAEKLTPDDYTRALHSRELLRGRHRSFEGRVDAFITLAHIGPAQYGRPPLGTPWYNDASSAIGAPTFNLPLLSVDDMPLGVQIMGYEGKDADLTGIARWLLEEFKSPMVGV